MDHLEQASLGDLACFDTVECTEDASVLFLALPVTMSIQEIKAKLDLTRLHPMCLVKRAIDVERASGNWREALDCLRLAAPIQKCAFPLAEELLKKFTVYGELLECLQKDNPDFARRLSFDRLDVELERLDLKSSQELACHLMSRRLVHVGLFDRVFNRRLDSNDHDLMEEIFGI